MDSFPLPLIACRKGCGACIPGLCKVKCCSSCCEDISCGYHHFQPKLKTKIARFFCGTNDEQISRNEIVTLTNYILEKEKKEKEEKEKREKEIEKEVVKKESENEVCCKICMENRVDYVFGCGHFICVMCSESIKKECPFCRDDIKTKIKVYF